MRVLKSVCCADPDCLTGRLCTDADPEARATVYTDRAMRFDAAAAVLERVAADGDRQTKATLLTIVGELRANAKRWWEAAG